jgi:hypothetical protein
MSKQNQAHNDQAAKQTQVKPVEVKAGGEETAVVPIATLRRAYADPRTITPADARSLQRTLGNRAVGRLFVQRKMALGPVGDAYEQEADATAKQVVASLSHVPTHQQTSKPANQQTTQRQRQQPHHIQRLWGSSKNKSAPPPAQVLKKSDHQGQLDTIASAVVPKLVADGKVKVLNYLAGGLGKGGAHFWRSQEVRAFRAKMKSAARAQAWGDISAIVQQGDVFDDAELEVGPAMKDHIEVVAKDKAYAKAKKSVDAVMQEIAEDWMSRNWADDTIIGVASTAASDAAWNIYKENPKESTWKEASKAAAKAAAEAVNAQVTTHLALAKAAKNEVLKPAQDQQVTSAEDQQQIASMVADKAHTSDVGLKSLQKAITCNTTDEGLGIVGKFLDQVIPLPGEQVSLDISLKIPTSDGVSYVVLKLMGKAGRGITGFSTSGVTTLGNPKRLEVMAQFSVGAGAETFGLKAEASIGFFTRAGSDQGTAATMKALSYGGYRAASGIKSEFGNWWAGGGKGSNLSAEERAEMWAAAIEEQVFKESEDGSGESKNAFADIGGSLSGSGGIGVKDVFSAEMGLGGEVFKRYDAAALEGSLGANRFGKPVRGAAQARERRRQAKGRTTTSFGVSASVDVKILGQAVSFAGSLSMENDFDQNVARDNWGVEISAAIGTGSDPLSAVEKIASGIVTGSLSIAQNLAAIVQKEKVGSGIDILADITQITNAGLLENQIASSLSELWSVDGSKFEMGIGASGTPEAASGLGVSSTIQVAITFGKSGGKGVFRFEIRDSKGIDVSVGLGSVGLSISAAKGKRILALGYEGGGFVAEAIGLRAPRKK